MEVRMATDRYSEMHYESELDAELKRRNIEVPEKVVQMNSEKRKQGKRQILRDNDKVRAGKKSSPKIIPCILLALFAALVLATVIVAVVWRGGEIGTRPAVVDVPTLPSVLMAAEPTYTLLPPQPTYTLLPPQPTYTPYPVEPTLVPPEVGAAVADDPISLITNPYMQNYESSLQYTISSSLQVPSNILNGFSPVASLVMTDLVFPNSYTIQVPEPPANVDAYACFPQDYSVSDAFNRGCQALQNQGELPWTTPIAGYNDGENWSCDSPDGWCADDIQSFNWRVITGYEVCHPAVGCLKDPDGGAVMILFVNFHDSDEVWGPRNNSAIYVDSGFIGYGMMWDLSGGTYNVGESIAALRNHYFYNLVNPVGGDNRYAGQCGTSGLCNTVTYVVVARVWDRPELGINYSHFELIDWGQWARP